MTYKTTRTLLILMITVCFQSTALSQKIIKCEKLNISFETFQVLEKYEESATETGYDNDDIAVDIELIEWDRSPDDYEKGAKHSAELFTRGLGFTDFKAGGKIPHIEESYYYVAKDEWDGKPFPVYVLIAMAPDKKSVYEITVYCYHNNTKEGQKLVESIRLMH